MRRRDDRGAIIPMVSLMLVALMGAAAFAVDLGMQRVARSDMQSLADAVALDLARLLDGRVAGEVRSGDAEHPSLATVVSQSTARNDDHTVGSAPAVTAELVELDASGAPVYANGAPKAVASDEVPEGVLVTARTAVGFGFSGGEGGALRTALAVTEPFACFSLGSYALAVDPGNGSDTESAQLNEMLEDALQVSALSYHGLADAKISLGGLAAEFDAVTPDELMSVTAIKLRDLFSATATVLAREGGSAADVSLLQTLAASGKSELDGRVDVGDLITVTSDSSAVLGTEIAVLDLVAAGAFASDGAHALDVPVMWSVPKFSSGATSLQVIERPARTCGKPGSAEPAKTAQLKFDAEPILHVGNVAGLTGNDPVVQMHVSLAGATADLAAVECGEGTLDSPEAITVDATRSLSTASLTIPITLTGSKSPTEVGLDLSAFGLSVAQILALGPSARATFDLQLSLSSSVTGPAGTSSATYQVPYRTYADPEPINDSDPVLVPYPTVTASSFSGTVTFGAQTRDIATLVSQGDINLTPVITALNTSVLQAGVVPFIDKVNEILTPTAKLLGLHVAGADLYGWSRPSCDVPALRG